MQHDLAAEQAYITELLIDAERERAEEAAREQFLAMSYDAYSMIADDESAALSDVFRAMLEKSPDVAAIHAKLGLIIKRAESRFIAERWEDEARDRIARSREDDADGSEPAVCHDLYSPG